MSGVVSCMGIQIFLVVVPKLQGTFLGFWFWEAGKFAKLVELTACI